MKVIDKIAEYIIFLSIPIFMIFLFIVMIIEIIKAII